MTDRRRLLAVTAVLALAAVVSFSHVWGEPARGPGGDKPRATDRVANVSDRSADTDRELLDDLAATKFAQRPVVTYKTKAGDTLFALQAQPKLEPVPARPRDIAILIDTSASQARGALTSATKLTETLLHSLGAEDRVAIYTVNATTRDLTRGWKAAADTGAALKALKDEYASGATNLKVGLQTALKNFESRAGRQQLILFLGDGMSILNPITAKERAEVSAEMVRSAVAFFPVPLGPRLDPSTLHGLAGTTGGAPVRMLPGDKPETVVKRFLEVISAPILYPTTVKWQGDVVESFPTRLPPLRSDTPTLVIGRLKSGDKVGYQVVGTVAGKEVKAEQTETLSTPEIDNFFLVGMLHQWREAKDAAALIRADRALAFADQENRLARLELVARAEWALAENQHEAALRIFEQVKQLNPEDADARAGIQIVKKLKEGVITLDKLRATLQPKPGDAITRIGKGADGKMRSERLVLLAQAGGGAVGVGKDPAPAGGGQAAAGGGANPIAPAEGPKDILKENLDRRAVEEQRVARVVDDALFQAGRLVREGNPEAAHDLIKRTLDGIRNNPDIGERSRAGLTDRLQAGLRSADLQGLRVLRDREDRLQRMAAMSSESPTRNGRGSACVASTS
jgi:tetratricopeptide (TPR) repeat protein